VQVRRRIRPWASGSRRVPKLRGLLEPLCETVDNDKCEARRRVHALLSKRPRNDHGRGSVSQQGHARLGIRRRQHNRTGRPIPVALVQVLAEADPTSLTPLSGPVEEIPPSSFWSPWCVIVFSTLSFLMSSRQTASLSKQPHGKQRKNGQCGHTDARRVECTRHLMSVSRKEQRRPLGGVGFQWGS